VFVGAHECVCVRTSTLRPGIRARTCRCLLFAYSTRKELWVQICSLCSARPGLPIIERIKCPCALDNVQAVQRRRRRNVAPREAPSSLSLSICVSRSLRLFSLIYSPRASRQLVARGTKRAEKRNEARRGRYSSDK